MLVGRQRLTGDSRARSRPEYPCHNDHHRVDERQLSNRGQGVGYDVTMNISITLPDDVAEQMQAHGCNLPRRALEVLVADGYRAGILTGAQVQRILGLGSRSRSCSAGPGPTWAMVRRSCGRIGRLCESCRIRESSL